MWLLLYKPATKLPTSILSLFLHFHRPSRNFSDILLIKLASCMFSSSYGKFGREGNQPLPRTDRTDTAAFPNRGSLDAEMKQG